MIQDKSTLAAEIAALFPDNSNGEISAADQRNYLTSILDSNLLQKIEITNLDAPVENLLISDIDENVLFVNNPGGPQTVNLPLIEPSIETLRLRGLVLTGPVTIVPQGGDVIVGEDVFTDSGYIDALISSGEWIVSYTPIVPAFRLLKDVPDSYAGQAGKRVVVNGTEDALEFVAQPAKALVSAYFEDDVSSTVINTTGVYETINGTYSNGAIHDFTVGTDDITFDGAAAKVFAYDVTCAGLKAGGGTANYNVALHVNGVIHAPKSGVTLNNSDDISLGLTGIVLLTTNDVVTVKIASVAGTNDVDVNDLNVRLVEIE